MFIRHHVLCTSYYQYVESFDYAPYDEEVIRIYIFGIKHWTLLYENECLARICNDKISINTDEGQLKLSFNSVLYGNMTLSYTLECNDKTYCLTNDALTINYKTDEILNIVNDMTSIYYWKNAYYEIKSGCYTYVYNENQQIKKIYYTEQHTLNNKDIEKLLTVKH